MGTNEQNETPRDYSESSCHSPQPPGPFSDELQQLKVLLERCEAKLQALLLAVPDLVFVLDADQRFVSYHTTQTRLLYPPEMFLGKRHGEVMGPEMDALFQPAFEKVRRGEIAEYSYPLMMQEGRRWFSARLTPWQVKGQFHGAVVVIRDVTERRFMQEEIVVKTTRDSLTGLPNRILFRDRLDQALRRRARPDETLAAMYYVDLDRFKILNEAIGHSQGDEVLREVAARLRSLVRPADTVARLGSDEFAVLAEGFDSIADITRMADRLCEILNRPYFLSGREQRLTASLGVVVIEGADATTVDRVMRDAEAALANAKRVGRGKYAFFALTMHEEALRTLALENDLHRALNLGELCVHYQPIVGVRDRGIVGLEALVRWPHPTRGWVPPSEFIPVAEEAGLICALDFWVFEQVCRQVRAWEASSRELAARPWWVSVNFSVEHFANGKFVQAIRDMLDRIGVAPQRLSIELTESAFLRYAEKAREVLGGLDQMGLRTCLDDFGTGYSAMGYLRHLPIHVLKIDLSFLRDVPGNDKAETLVRVMTILGKGLNLMVLAEGVEQETQFNFLQNIGCDLVQGYYFGRPMPPEEAGCLLAKGVLD